jgi:hypothetical protein
MTSRGSLHRVARNGIAVTVLALALVAGVQLATAHPRVSHPGATDRRDLVTAGACGLNDGRVQSLPQALTRLSYTLPMPHSQLADKATLRAIRVCSSTRRVLDFSTGIRMYTDVNDLVKPADNWRRVASSDPLEASVGSVDGASALLIDPAKDPTGSAKGSVTFVRGRVWIVVEGSGSQPLQTLVAVANSVR